ncbi:hypothetical protein CVT24_008366 [Panaeolus cyanescens]|uniref:Myb-like domain-containing protein n=1 Tax=Panaeolus cyanescens TaxID=181874 RepID=A0A409VD76_9AGAR|nr:hypothetical protein CVT24_008366 [Panaeolus cyanescens]
MATTNKHPSLKYLGLPDDYKPSPETETIKFLKLHLNQLPPHIATYFSSLITPKERSILAPIRNRRLAYTNQNPKELRFEYARNTWPELWSGPKPHPGQEESSEEQAWARNEFLQGGTQHVGKLAKLLGDYEEEREAERARAERRNRIHQQIDDDFVPEEESDSDDDEPSSQTVPQESEQEMKKWFERLIRERFIYGLLEAIDALHSALTSDSLQSQQDNQTKHKKKRKRTRDNEHSENDNATSKNDSERKKKRKHADAAEKDAASSHQSSAVPDIASSAESAPSKPKKKKKDKGKQAEPTDAEIEASSQASAAALLSAIVAASVVQPDPQNVSAYESQIVNPPEQQFSPFQQVPYGFMPLPHPPFDPNGPQPSAVFGVPQIPPAAGNAFTDLSFSSNEDVLRALQDLDITKLTNALKTLGDTTQSNPYSSQLSFNPVQLQQAQPSLPMPTTSTGIAPSRTVKTPDQTRTLNISLPGHEHSVPADHAHLLANKWLNTNKLAELVKTEGLVYKKGKFSAIEEHQLESAIKKYQEDKNLSDVQLSELIFAKHDKNKDQAFWSELTYAVPLRPIIAVYHHVRRVYHPLRQQGTWKTEEDNALKQAVNDLGQQWEKVSLRVGRMASDCRDRWRNHIVNRDIRTTGHWTAEEEEKLTNIVLSMTAKQGKDSDSEVFWGKVSDLMGGTRGRQQCRIKWTDSLSKKVKTGSGGIRWNQQDAFILVHKVDSLNVRDDTEIDWKTISDPDWNLWSAHTLQRRWLTLKRSVKGYEDMTHQEIMDILRVKKAVLPPLPATSSKKKKERKVTSAEAVHEPDSRDSNDSSSAGSSTGTGTTQRR